MCPNPQCARLISAFAVSFGYAREYQVLQRNAHCSLHLSHAIPGSYLFGLHFSHVIPGLYQFSLHLKHATSEAKGYTDLTSRRRVVNLSTFYQFFIADCEFLSHKTFILTAALRSHRSGCSLSLA
jgi:hypothetical protein